MIFFFNVLLQIFKSTILLFLILYDYKIYNFLDQFLLILTGSILNESICFFIVSDTESDAGSASDSATDSVSDSDADFEEIRQDLIDTIEEDKAGQEGQASRRNIWFEADRLRIEQDFIRLAEEVAEADAARTAARIAARIAEDKADPEGQAVRIAEDAAEATRRNIYFEAVRLQIDQDLIAESAGSSEAESKGSSETKSEGFSGTGRLSKKRKRED